VAVARRLRPDIIVIDQTRKGRGNALACGFAAATGDVIAVLSADGSTDPAELPRFIAALEDGADFAKGSRFLPGAGSSDISRTRRIGNFWLNRVTNLLYRTRYTDLCYGYNAFRRDCLTVINLDGEESRSTGGSTVHTDGSTALWGDGFEVQTLINVRIARAGLRVSEVPSFERSRGYVGSNLDAFSDGLRVLRTIHVERKREGRRVGEPPAVAPAIASLP
jgi:glycosyltransferase involved in cell wall biosynthesis